MKSLIYISSLLMFSAGLWSGSSHAQAVFNDTILFRILKVRPAPNGSRYLMDFQGAESSNSDFTGKMVLSMCNCYCDSLWDAWPAPSDSVMAGGTATLTSMSTSNSGNSGGFGNQIPNRQRGVLNIWQMPGSFSLTEAFSLPVVFKLD